VDDEELFADLAERLRVAHLRVASLTAPEAEKASITKHLLVITDASKRDLRKASKRLDAFLADLDARHPSAPGSG
jgi:hypothetical protein